MLDQPLHGRIKAIAVLELDSQAFGEIARADAGRFQRLQHVEYSFDLVDRSPELLRHLREASGEVARLVDQIDEILCNQLVARIRNDESHLLGQMPGKR